MNQIGLRKEERMKINKKYVAGSVAVLALSVCSYELGRYQAGQVKKDSNRVAYIDGDQAGQKAENLTPEEVNKRENQRRTNCYQDYGSRLCDFSWKPLSLL